MILRRTRGDLIATAVIAAVAIAAIAIVWATAPIRGSELTVVEEFAGAESLDTVPDSLTEAWHLTDLSPRANVISGVVVSVDDNTVYGSTPDGDFLWVYERDVPLCAISTAFGSVIASYLTGVGCGDVVSIHAATGEYSATRSSLASDHVVPIASNDHVGILSPDRLELWRSDMVRTLEYGVVEAKQEAGQQPNEGCTLTSAMTRTNLVALTESCTDGTWLRFQDTTPEDSREPEILNEVMIDQSSRLVAVGQESAAIYIPEHSRIDSFSNDGALIESSAVAPAVFPDVPYAPMTSDLPHHMSWFDGERLTLFTPGELAVGAVFEDAIGTGIAVDDMLLYPTATGISVADWDTGETFWEIPLDRDGWNGEVELKVAGETIVEKRGDLLVGLRA